MPSTRSIRNDIDRIRRQTDNDEIEKIAQLTHDLAKNVESLEDKLEKARKYINYLLAKVR